MSILAQPRRKVRYNINPNGNTWANDTSKYGKKMLEKMGWSHGKGLGVKLDGMTTHVKVHHKSDQKGVGFEDRNDQWTEHEDKFSALLKNLQTDGHAPVTNEESKENGTTSLEMKSKSSKSRVHYKKFTRGKDLSRYSSKDLANIFGRKTLERKVIKVEEIQENVDENVKSEEDKKFGVQTVEGGSMTDYFKMKMENLKVGFGSSSISQATIKPEEIEEENKDDEEKEDDEEEHRGFGFGFNSEQDTGFSELKAGKYVTSIKHVKAKKRKLKGLETSEKSKTEKETSEQKVIGSEENVEENGKSGEGKKFGVQTVEGRSMTDYFKKKMENLKFGFGNSSISKPTLRPDEIKQEKEDDGEENHGFGFNSGQGLGFSEVKQENGVSSIKNEKIKKRKRKSLETNEESKKEKKRKFDGFDNLAIKLEDNGENQVVEENPYELKVEHGALNPTFHDSFEVVEMQPENGLENTENVVIGQNPYELIPENVEKLQGKKKKKKNKDGTGGVVNPSFNALETQIHNATNDGKKKKKKKKDKNSENLQIGDNLTSLKDCGLVNPIFNPVESENVSIKIENVNPYELISDKKKKKKTKDVSKMNGNNLNVCGFVNPTFNPLESEAGSIEIENVNSYEVISDKKKKKKKSNDISKLEEETVNVCGLVNPTFNFNPLDSEGLSITNENNPYEIVLDQKKTKKKKTKENSKTEEHNVNACGFVNPTFKSLEIEDLTKIESRNPYEIVPEKKTKDKRKKKEQVIGIENPTFNNEIIEDEKEETPKKTKKKKKSSTEPEPEPETVSSPKTQQETSVDNFGITTDLIMNIASLPDPKPILHTPKNKQDNRTKRRKSVRIDESLNQELIIPNILQQKQLQQQELFDINTQIIERGMEEERKQTLHGVAKDLENYQAEVENDINESKSRQQREATVYVGGSATLTENARLSNGHVVLAHADCDLSTRFNHYHQSTNGAKGSYKHLIKGDIEIAFVNSNLHEIDGYATVKKSRKIKSNQ